MAYIRWEGAAMAIAVGKLDQSEFSTLSSGSSDYISRLGGFWLLFLSPDLKSQPNHSDVADDGGYILHCAQDQTRTLGACDWRALARRTTGSVWDSFAGPRFDSKLTSSLSWLRLESKQQKAWHLGADFHVEVGGRREHTSASGRRI